MNGMEWTDLNIEATVQSFIHSPLFSNRAMFSLRNKGDEDSVLVR